MKKSLNKNPRNFDDTIRLQ